MANLFAGTPLPSRYDRVEKPDTSGVIQSARIMDIRDRELHRRFEVAEAQRRQDINDAAQYNAAALGQLGEGYQMLVNDVVSDISSGELDATQARVAISNLKSQYATLASHLSGIEEVRQLAEKAAKGDADAVAQLESSFGVGEELNYSYPDYVAALDQATNHIYIDGSLQMIDGELTAEDRVTGVRKPLSLLTGFGDASYWFPLTSYRRPVDVGDLDDWAKSEETQKAITFRFGFWTKEESDRVYYDNITQMSEEGKKHRLQVLAALEENGMISHFDAEKRRQFRDGINLDTDQDFIVAIERGRNQFRDRTQSSFELSELAKTREKREKKSSKDAKRAPKEELADAQPYKEADLSGVTFLGKDGRQLSDDEVLNLAVDFRGLGPFAEGLQLPGVDDGWTYPMRSLKDESINILNPDYQYITEDPVDGEPLKGEKREPNGPQVLMNLKLDETTWLKDGSLLIKNATDTDGRRISDIYLDAERNADIIVKVIQAIREAYKIPVTAEELGTGKAREYSGVEVIEAAQPRGGSYDNL
jgi:hypothetical protein